LQIHVALDTFKPRNTNPPSVPWLLSCLTVKPTLFTIKHPI